MKAYKECQKMGLTSLKELSIISGKSEQTLLNWHGSKGNNIDNSKAFNLILKGAVVEKNEIAPAGYDTPNQIKNEIIAELSSLSLSEEAEKEDIVTVDYLINRLFNLKKSLSICAMKQRGSID